MPSVSFSSNACVFIYLRTDAIVSFLCLPSEASKAACNAFRQRCGSVARRDAPSQPLRPRMPLRPRQHAPPHWHLDCALPARGLDARRVAGPGMDDEATIHHIGALTLEL